MQAAQCSSLASSQMRPGAGRKSLESLYPGIIFLPVLMFDFVFLLQGILQEGGAQTSGVSVSIMPLGFLKNYQGRYFVVVITNQMHLGLLLSYHMHLSCYWRQRVTLKLCLLDIFCVHVGLATWDVSLIGYSYGLGSAQGQILATPCFLQVSVDLASRSSMPKEIWASLILTFHVGKGLSSGFLPRINWESHRALLAALLSNLDHARRKVSLFCNPYIG